jgi:hypothetical protein
VVEHLHGKEGVRSSILLLGSTSKLASVSALPENLIRIVRELFEIPKNNPKPAGCLFFGRGETV